MKQHLFSRQVEDVGIINERLTLFLHSFYDWMRIMTWWNECFIATYRNREKARCKRSRMQILLVEDDEVDVEYMVRSLRRQGFQQPIHIASNGVEALRILRSAGEEIQATLPWLIITDIQMPLMNGLEFLCELRSDPNLHRLVTFVLTSSNLEEDKRAAYEERIAGYLLKADLSKNFSALVDLLNAYQSLIKLP